MKYTKPAIPRCGCSIYKGVEVPTSAKIITDKYNREGYFIGTEKNQYYFKYIDNNEIRIFEYEQIKHIL
jgi:penicillin V acylase-like amidase (Ntn superfamily)